MFGRCSISYRIIVPEEKKYTPDDYLRQRESMILSLSEKLGSSSSEQELDEVRKKLEESLKERKK